MSALAGSPRAVDGGRRPSLFRLLGAVLGGEVLAAVQLWIGTIVLGLIGIAPIGGRGDWVWLPWQLDGIWALIGAIGWGYLVCSLVAAAVSRGIERRGYGRPAAEWMRISIAVSGYGAMAVGRTAGAHIVAAVVAGAIMIRLAAFNLDGSPREWRWALPERHKLAGTVLAVLVAVSYSGLHGFVADGDGGTFPNGTIHARVGHTVTLYVGLSHMLAPVTITGLSLGGTGTRNISSSALIINPNPGVTMIPDSLRSYPGAHHFSGYVWHPTRLPYLVAAGTAEWVSLNVTLTTCARVTVNMLKLHYTVLGIATGQSVPLQQPLRMSCGH